MKAWFISILLIILLPCVSGRLGNLDGLLSDVIPGQYILEIKREADLDEVLTRIYSIADRQEEAASVLFRYNIILNGVAMKGLAKDTVRLLERDQDIIRIMEVCTLTFLFIIGHFSRCKGILIIDDDDDIIRM